jgi:hypothetical protein
MNAADREISLFLSQAFLNYPMTQHSMQSGRVGYLGSGDVGTQRTTGQSPAPFCETLEGDEMEEWHHLQVNNLPA